MNMRKSVICRIGLLLCYLSVVACQLLFTGCQDDDRREPAGAVAVQFTSSVAGQSVATRAYNDMWEPGDKVGLFMLNPTKGGSDATIPGKSEGNHVYITDNTQDATLANLTSGGIPLYFPMDGSGVRFVGYSPYRSGVNTKNVPINVGGTTEQKLNEIDFIYHADADGVSYNKKSPNVPLTFKHRLSKITVIVQLPNGVNDVPLDDAPGLQITGMPTTATFDLDAGTLHTLGGTTAVVSPAFRNAESDGTAAIWDAILVPHTGANADGSGRVFTFSFGGVNYTYILPENQAFVAGSAYVFNFKISASGVSLDKSSLVDWAGGTVAWGGYLLTATNTVFNVTKVGANKVTGALEVKFSTTATTATPTVTTSLQGDTETDEKADWITPVITEGSEANGWKDWTLTFTVPDRYIYNLTRTGYILFNIEGLTIATTVNQDAGEGLFLTKNTPTGSGITHAYTAGTASFTLDTNSEEQPQIKYSADGVWANAKFTPGEISDLFSPTSITPSTYAASGLTNYRYRYNYAYTMNPTTTSAREVYIHARVEDDPATEKIYLLTQNKIVPTAQKTTQVADGMSNMYIVPAGTSVVFPVTRAYNGVGSDVLRIGGTYLGKFTLSKVWDSNNVVDLANSKVEYEGKGAFVTISTSSSGNAVVHLKDESGTPVWAYYITTYPHGAINGWLDRPLGSSVAPKSSLQVDGCLFQMNRPWPVPGAVYNGAIPAYTPAAYSGAVTSVKNLVASAGRLSDWPTFNHPKLPANPKDLWDPCPHGYRVMDYASWDALHFANALSDMQAKRFTSPEVTVRTQQCYDHDRNWFASAYQYGPLRFPWPIWPDGEKRQVVAFCYPEYAATDEDKSNVTPYTRANPDAWTAGNAKALNDAIYAAHLRVSLPVRCIAE